MKALILAAGLGTRLGPLTAGLPKCMLRVDGVPLVEHLVRWLRHHGISDIAVNVHYRPDAIVDHLGTGERLDVRITYSHEPTLLGTAGAARNLQSYLDIPFVVVYGDGFTNVDLSRLIRLHEARRTVGRPHITMALQRVPNPEACGLADLDAERRIIRFVEKPPPDQIFTDLASAGIMVVEPEVLDLIPTGVSVDFGRDTLPLALERGFPIYGEPLLSHEYLIDIGTREAYRRACELAQSRPGVSASIAGTGRPL